MPFGKRVLPFGNIVVVGAAAAVWIEFWRLLASVVWAKLPLTLKIKSRMASYFWVKPARPSKVLMSLSVG